MGCTLRALSSAMSSSVPSAGNLSIPLSVHKGTVVAPAGLGPRPGGAIHLTQHLHPILGISHPTLSPSSPASQHKTAQVFQSCCCIPQQLLCQCHEPQAVVWQLSSPLPTYIFVTLLKKKFCHQHSNLLENKNTWKSPARCAILDGTANIGQVFCSPLGCMYLLKNTLGILNFETMHHCLLEEKSHQHYSILFLLPDFSDSTLRLQTQILGDIHENENHSIALKKKKKKSHI